MLRGNKLKPERSKLVKELGLQTRQVAVLGKTKQLERDNEDHKEKYKAVIEEKQKLKYQMMLKQSLLRERNRVSKRD